MRRDRVYLQHILDSILAIQKFIKGVSKKNFLKNRLIQSAVLRELEIIGEATKNLSREVKKKYSEIPWKKIAGMRDKLIHAYFGVDLDLVWETIKEEIPKLERKIREILRKEFKVF